MVPKGTRLIERAGAQPVLWLRKSRLVVVRGPDKGKHVNFASPVLAVGTSPDMDVVLADPTVSAKHFELRFDDEGCVLRDRESTNGTFVGGMRIREAYVADGAQIVAGETTLRLKLLDGHVEIPLSPRDRFGGLRGDSTAMRAAFAVLERAAASDSTVLVHGESGTGKELAARAIHEASPRRDGPLVVCDCGAVAASLAESQLFGHARGAFTGAAEARPGVFEEADGGTLVLDELGELPLELQPKLLRAVESRTVTRLGETTARPVDIRLVACTNRNLDEEVRAGRFRQDLYFRLSVITVRLPALREHREDIPALVAQFLGGRAQIPRHVLELFASHGWPGNVRELRNVVERMLVLPDADPAVLLGAVRDVPEVTAQETALSFHDAKQRNNDRFELAYLSRLLEQCGGNISEVARVAALSRQTCYRLMHKHGIRTD
jgi:transcriptional regulator with PAS, ATPase and Fis domain